MLCILNHFCCCFSLQTGTKVIGAFSMMFGTLGLGQSISVMITMANQVDAATKPKFSFELKKTTIFPFSWIIVSTIMIGVTIPVLVAACKNRNALLLLPWLVLDPFFTIIGVAFKLYKGILSINDPDQLIESASSIAAALIVTVMEFYICLVVYNYYRQLQETQNENNKCRSDENIDPDVTTKYLDLLTTEYFKTAIIIEYDSLITLTPKHIDSGVITESKCSAHENEAYENSSPTSTKHFFDNQNSPLSPNDLTSFCKRNNDKLPLLSPTDKKCKIFLEQL